MTASDLTLLAATGRGVLILDGTTRGGVRALPVLTPAQAEDPDTIVVMTADDARHYLRTHRTGGQAASTATIDIRIATFDVDVELRAAA